MAFELDLSFAGVGDLPNRQPARRTAPVRPVGRPRRILCYLLLSLLLHAVALPSLLHDRIEMAIRSAPPLSVVLSPSRPPVHPAPVRAAATQPTPAVAHRTARVGTPADAATRTTSDAAPAPQAEPTKPARPAIDLAATFAAARAMARGSQFGPMPTGPKPLPTVDSVIARAVAPEVEVETRGSNGEHVLRVGNKRCVTPLLAPHFMEGVAMPTQCEIRKG